MNTPMRPLDFLIKVTIAHAASYFVVGIIAATVFDYESLFADPVISDYMRGFGSVALFVGPVVQLIRGLITALVLLPFRSALATRHGWLWLWLLLIGVGVLSTSAAAPSSIEGVVYTKLPLWYHLIGLPEMLLQTLIFSLLVFLVARHPEGVLASLPPVFERTVRAAVAASLAFVGYAVVSVIFALGAGAEVTAEQSLTLRVQGMFIAPFVLCGAIAFVAARGLSPRNRLAAAGASYVLGSLSIFLYQAIIMGAASPLYALVAPILPALILWLLIPREGPGGDALHVRRDGAPRRVRRRAARGEALTVGKEPWDFRPLEGARFQIRWSQRRRRRHEPIGDAVMGKTNDAWARKALR